MNNGAQSSRPAPFRLGINYWPARSAMRWWTAFDPEEVASDFHRIADAGFDSVRIFLLWEDFQPAPTRVDATKLDHLVVLMDVARDAGLAVMPTLFTGHMSGVNWAPRWALGNDSGDQRFRIVAGGQVTAARLANWYSDASLLRAQASFAREAANALAGHDALFAWDLGNENSNCVIPADKASAREWLLRMTHAIRGADDKALITLGLHMEDLEQDRKIGPREAAEVCDFLTMHGYPGYAAWSDGPTDHHVLPFLARLTRWLGGGVEVLFSEFGVPTVPNLAAGGATIVPPEGPALVSEADAAAYVARALRSLWECGCMGAMLWCYADYAESIWTLPPLDIAVHERFFGLWRADASPKPTVSVVKAFARSSVAPSPASPFPADSTWIDIGADEFYSASASELPRLYRRYRAALSLSESQ